MGDPHQPGGPAFAGWFRNRRKMRFRDAVLGDDDFFAALGGVDQRREMRLGFVEIDGSRHGVFYGPRVVLVKLVKPPLSGRWKWPGEEGAPRRVVSPVDRSSALQILAPKRLK